MSTVLDELEWRGLLAQTTDRAALEAALAAGPVTVYCGFDPTGPSLHHGNLVQLIVLRHMQRAGHHVLALVGGSTGMIGDPRMSGERVLNPVETIRAWEERLRSQISRVLDFDGDNPATMVNNYDWTKDLTTLDFLRDIGKHYRLGTMLAKDIVARRLASDEGISFTEFSYQILQGLDFLEQYRRYGCTLQTGGNDQWGNLLSGVELIRKAAGGTAHALATPLITKADGTKFGKTEGGAVWLAPDMMSPYAFYQFWLNTDDADVARFLRVFTFRTREEIAALEEAVAQRPAAREAQRTLAQDVTTLVHGADATAKAIAASQALFGRGSLTDLDAQTLDAAVAELPAASGAVGDHLLDLFVAAGLEGSKGAARRALASGGLSVNNERVADEDALLAASDLLTGRYAVLRRGRRNLAVVRVAPGAAPRVAPGEDVA